MSTHNLRICIICFVQERIRQLASTLNVRTSRWCSVSWSCKTALSTAWLSKTSMPGVFLIDDFSITPISHGIKTNRLTFTGSCILAPTCLDTIYLRVSALCGGSWVGCMWTGLALAHWVDSQLGWDVWIFALRCVPHSLSRQFLLCGSSQWKSQQTQYYWCWEAKWMCTELYQT